MDAIIKGLTAWPYVEMASWPAAYFEKNEAGVETT